MVYLGNMLVRTTDPCQKLNSDREHGYLFSLPHNDDHASCAGLCRMPPLYYTSRAPTATPLYNFRPYHRIKLL